MKAMEVKDYFDNTIWELSKLNLEKITNYFSQDIVKELNVIKIEAKDYDYKTIKTREIIKDYIDRLYFDLEDYLDDDTTPIIDSFLKNLRKVIGEKYHYYINLDVIKNNISIDVLLQDARDFYDENNIKIMDYVIKIHEVIRNSFTKKPETFLDGLLDEEFLNTPIELRKKARVLIQKTITAGAIIVFHENTKG
ncbi:MAG: hypothetical protein LBV58_00410 [Acholeplasmatales bacterium]|jgi:hypothetical protein|nr:hypothetical protein [Acholeplasmatales bacterium]